MDKKVLTKANEQLDIISTANKAIKVIDTIFNSEDTFIENNSTLYSDYSRTKIQAV